MIKPITAAIDPHFITHSLVRVGVAGVVHEMAQLVLAFLFSLWLRGRSPAIQAMTL